MEPDELSSIAFFLLPSSIPFVWKIPFIQYDYSSHLSLSITFFWSQMLMFKDRINFINKLFPNLWRVQCCSYSSSFIILHIDFCCGWRCWASHSTTFSNYIRNVSTEDDEIMVSFDVTSLYTDIPIIDTLNIIKDFVNNDD